MEQPEARTEHDARIIAHYENVTEELYLGDHNPDHIHFGYWEQGAINHACIEIDRECELPDALHRTMEKALAPADLGDKDLVVDAGCGVGGTARYLANTYGCHVHGLDYTPALIATAREKTNELPEGLKARIEYHLADVTRPWPIGAQTVDTAVSIESGLYYQRRTAFIEEVVRALRPGGRLVLVDWMRTEPMTVDAYIEHITPICHAWHAWSLESLTSYSDKLKAAGLVIVEAEDFAAHALPNAHMLLRDAERYDAHGWTHYAQWCRVLAEAWLARRFTLGRLLAIKPEQTRVVQALPTAQAQGTQPRPSEAPTPTLPELCWSVRRHGVLVAESDPNEPDTQRTLDALQAVASRPGDTFVVSSLEWSEPVRREEWTTLLQSTNQGTIGVAFTTEHGSEIIAPERTIAWNETLPQALQRFLEKGLGGRYLELRTAKSETKLVRTGEPTLEAELYRGTSLVPLEPEQRENRALTIATGIACGSRTTSMPRGASRTCGTRPKRTRTTPRTTPYGASSGASPSGGSPCTRATKPSTTRTGETSRTCSIPISNRSGTAWRSSRNSTPPTWGLRPWPASRSSPGTKTTRTIKRSPCCCEPSPP